MFRNVSLDCVYLNYLQNKVNNPEEKEEATKSKSKKGARSRRQSLKPPSGSQERRNSAPKLEIPKTPKTRRNRSRSPNAAVQQSKKTSKDDLDFQNSIPKPRGRRGSLPSGHLFPQVVSNASSFSSLLGEIQENETSDKEDKPATPSPALSQNSVNKESEEDEETKYTNNLKEKEEVTKSNSKRRAKTPRQSPKHTLETQKSAPKLEIPKPRRNSNPKVVVEQAKVTSKDDLDFQNSIPRQRGRRGSLPSDHLFPQVFSSALTLGGIQEDEKSDEETKPTTLSLVHSQSSVKEESEEEEEIKNTGDADEKESKQKEDISTKVKDEDLLLTLLKKNVRDSEYTPEQKALYDAHDTLWDEYQRRKAQRKRLGRLLRLKAKQLRSILGTIKGQKKESDLALKARSNELQERKRKERKKKRRFSSYGAVSDQNAI